MRRKALFIAFTYETNSYEQFPFLRNICVKRNKVKLYKILNFLTAFHALVNLVNTSLLMHIHISTSPCVVYSFYSCCFQLFSVPLLNEILYVPTL